MLGWVWGSRGLYLCAFFCSHFIFPCPLCLLGPLTLRVLWGIYQCFSWNPQDQSINQLSKNHSLRSDGSLVHRYASLVLILSCSLPMPVLPSFILFPYPSPSPSLPSSLLSCSVILKRELASIEILLCQLLGNSFHMHRSSHCFFSASSLCKHYYPYFVEEKTEGQSDEGNASDETAAWLKAAVSDTSLSTPWPCLF